MSFHNPILITGAHRSGKTWIAKGIQKSKKVNYIDQPLHKGKRVSQRDISVNYWYYYINNKNGGEYYDDFTKILNYKINYHKRLIGIKDYKDILYLIKAIIYSTKNRIFKNHRPIIDDPFALVSAEWLYQTFNFDVIVVIRHPCAFISSLKIRNYKFPFEHFLSQNDLMRDKFSHFENEIRDYTIKKRDIVSQGILLWNILYSAVSSYKREYHDKWVFVRFEDVILNPVTEFRKIFKKINLEFNHDIEKRLVAYSKKRNIKEEKYERIGKYLGNYTYPIQSQKDVYKLILTEREISLIKEQTQPVWEKFYDNSNW